MGERGRVGEPELTVVNFGHPLTAAQRAQIAELTGSAVGRVIDVPATVDDGQPFAAQAARLAAAAGLDAEAWQTLPLVVNLPGYAPLAVVLLAHLHGRCGHFPAVLRLRPIDGAVPARFEVAEVLDLQAARTQGRFERQEEQWQ